MTSESNIPARKLDQDASASIDSTIMETIEWLAGDECHDADEAGLVAGLGNRLRATGMPLDRMTLHLRTLHPEILGRTVAWAPNEAVAMQDREHGIERSAAVANSPIWHVMEKRKPLVVRLESSQDPEWIHTDLFEGRDLVEFVIVPLCNADGMVSAASFATTHARGFTIGERAALGRIVPALRNACELRILRMVELTLLDTYVGAKTARRVLAGHIRRGQVEILEAALMLCDLRGFTELSNRLSAARVLDLLNSYFDHVVPAITYAGGEVIKFMGDAVLAFFSRDSAAASCSVALQSAFDVLEDLGRVPALDATLRAGIALHYGEVAYGNIGTGQRLDFTLIGRDVNLVSRIQDVCRDADRPLLMSESFAGLLSPAITKTVGRHVLRGFPEEIAIYAPVENLRHGRPEGN